MGKWDSIIQERGLERLPLESPDYQARVDMAKTEFQGLGSAGLAERYVNLYKERAGLEAQVKAINLRMAALVQLAEHTFEGEGLSSLKLANGAAFRLQHEPYAVVEDHEKFRQWCIENGYESQLKLLWQTTNSIVKELLERNEPEPPGVKAFFKTKPVATGVK